MRKLIKVSYKKSSKIGIHTYVYVSLYGNLVAFPILQETNKNKAINETIDQIIKLLKLEKKELER